MNKNNPNLIRTELESLAAVQNRLNTPESTWHDVVIQRVDLGPLDAPLSRATLAGCQFLGCDLGPLVAGVVAQSQSNLNPKKRCLVFPKMPWLPLSLPQPPAPPDPQAEHKKQQPLDAERTQLAKEAREKYGVP